MFWGFFNQFKFKTVKLTGPSYLLIDLSSSTKWVYRQNCVWCKYKRVSQPTAAFPIATSHVNSSENVNKTIKSCHCARKILQSRCPTDMNSVIIYPPWKPRWFFPHSFVRMCVWREFPSFNSLHSILGLVSTKETSLILLIHAVKGVKQHFLYSLPVWNKITLLSGS